jgi:LysM repeat protein
MAAQSYTVRPGDTLGRIAQQHYGESSLFPQLARYNHIANPNSIMPGQVIQLPPKEDLLKGTPGGGPSHPGAPAGAVYSLYVRRYAPFGSFGGGFDGDGRDYSTSLAATARTVGVVTFSRKPGTDLAATGHSSGSSWVGPWEIRKKYPLLSVGRHIGQVRVTVSKVAVSENKISFTLYTEGNMPLKDIMLHEKIAGAVDKLNNALRPNSPHPQGTPDIDTFVDFSATFSADKAVFEGVVRGDGFPNAEVFVLDAASKPVGLLDYRTRSGIAGPYYRLFGAHAGNRLATFRREVDLRPDGSFGANASQPPAVVAEM